MKTFDSNKKTTLHAVQALLVNNQIRLLGLLSICALMMAGTTSVFALDGMAAEFDGVDDQVTIPYQAKYNIDDGDAFTLIIRVVAPQMQSSPNPVIMSAIDPVGGNDVFINRSGTGLGFGIGGATWNLPVIPMTDVWDNTCHVIALVREANTNDLTFYLDGVQQVTYSGVNGRLFFVNENIYLGVRPNLSGTNYQGEIDQFMIWTKALNATQIMGLQTACQEAFPGPPFLAGNWTFETCDDQIVEDYSAYYNHGYYGNDETTELEDPSCVINNCVPVCCDQTAANFQVPSPIIINQPVTFNNTSAGAVFYEWYVDGQFINNQTDLTYEFATPCNHIVTLYAYDGNCREARSKVVQALTAGTLDIFIETNNGTNFSPGNTIQYQVTVTNNTGATVNNSKVEIELNSTLLNISSFTSTTFSNPVGAPPLSDYTIPVINDGSSHILFFEIDVISGINVCEKIEIPAKIIDSDNYCLSLPIEHSTKVTANGEITFPITSSNQGNITSTVNLNHAMEINLKEEIAVSTQFIHTKEFSPAHVYTAGPLNEDVLLFYDECGLKWVKRGHQTDKFYLLHLDENSNTYYAKSDKILSPYAETLEVATGPSSLVWSWDYKVAPTLGDIAIVLDVEDFDNDKIVAAINFNNTIQIGPDINNPSNILSVSNLPDASRSVVIVIYERTTGHVVSYKLLSANCMTTDVGDIEVTHDKQIIIAGTYIFSPLPSCASSKGTVNLAGLSMPNYANDISKHAFLLSLDPSNGLNGNWIRGVDYGPLSQLNQRISWSTYASEFRREGLLAIDANDNIYGMIMGSYTEELTAVGGTTQITVTNPAWSSGPGHSFGTITKWDNNGEPYWMTSFANPTGLEQSIPNLEMAPVVDLDRIYLYGAYKVDFVFEYSGGGNTLVSHDPIPSDDHLLAELSASSGANISFQTFHGEMEDLGLDIEYNSHNRTYYLFGTFQYQFHMADYGLLTTPSAEKDMIIGRVKHKDGGTKPMTESYKFDDEPAVSAEDIPFSVIPAPNPFYDEMHLLIRGNQEEDIEVVVYDLMGRRVEEMLVAPETEKVLIGKDYSKGIYLVHVSNGTETEVLKINKLN